MEMVSCYRKSRRGQVTERSRQELLRVTAESLGAMANAGGGTVLLGADPEGETLGIFFDDRERNLFLRAMKAAFHPPFPFQLARRRWRERPLLRLTVLRQPRDSFFEERKEFSAGRSLKCSSLPGESWRL